MLYTKQVEQFDCVRFVWESSVQNEEGHVYVRLGYWCVGHWTTEIEKFPVCIFCSSLIIYSVFIIVCLVEFLPHLLCSSGVRPLFLHRTTSKMWYWSGGYEEGQPNLLCTTLIMYFLMYTVIVWAVRTNIVSVWFCTNFAHFRSHRSWSVILAL